MTTKAAAPARIKKPTFTKSEIQWTTEYDVFRRMKGNRPLDEKHVKEIMEAIQQCDLEDPVRINQDFEIVDGQHTFEARKRLGLQIPFIGSKEGDLEAVQRLNANRKAWTNENYVDSYIERGKKDYATYKWFRETYKMPHRPAIELLMAESWHTLQKKFISGQFKANNLEQAKKFAAQAMKLEPHFKYWNHMKFIAALQFVSKKKSFSWRRFLEKVEKHSWLLAQCPTTSMYIDLIERVFNYKSQNKVSLRYGD